MKVSCATCSALFCSAPAHSRRDTNSRIAPPISRNINAMIHGLEIGDLETWSLALTFGFPSFFSFFLAHFSFARRCLGVWIAIVCVRL